MRVLVSFLITLSLLASCATAHHPKAHHPDGMHPEGRPEHGSNRDIYQRYLAALQDAAIPTQTEIDTKLVALVRNGNYPLVWENNGAGTRVKVASLMSEATFQKYYATVGSSPTAPAAWGSIWVTAVPQLQNFCSALPGDAATKTRRLKEWLGLNPNGAYDRIVELWVDPSFVARPCPDNEVTDTTCSLDNGTANQPVDQPEYAAWFTNNYRFSYRENGFPWTRLGYTYDWAVASERSHPNHHVGASEFILRPSAQYTIAAAYTIEGYCSGR